MDIHNLGVNNINNMGSVVYQKKLDKDIIGFVCVNDDANLVCVNEDLPVIEKSKLLFTAYGALCAYEQQENKQGLALIFRKDK